MPTNRQYRRQQRRQRYIGLTPDLKRALLHGRAFVQQPTIEILRQAWQQHGDDLRAEWISQHPGTRPFAEWLFDLIPRYGERRIVDPRFRPEYRQAWLRYGILHTHTFPPNQEPEIDYLRRHQLLTDRELKQIR
jgi:hypothetical protein